MFLDLPSQTLEVSFRVKHGDGSYMVYASSGQLKCFECGDVGHKRAACPHKGQGAAGGSPAARTAHPKVANAAVADDAVRRAELAADAVPGAAVADDATSVTTAAPDELLSPSLGLWP